ncbi:MAG: aminotransferase class I/II-fold pyridoxal phosphate-dependent enzyme [Gammaproteobacteria bacterium]|nr:MAG: aminotransferase class I/II-fold pyridoxal phosphate-dependent enzyme [Gammaproteobacteria bacterium]QMU62655.1 MAG: aminotransferase class I/II-fold pyridoxal phosphate-dependent enzyme [Gammaproteobacteria bacterium]
MAKNKVCGPKVSGRLQNVNAFHVMSLMAEAKQLAAQGHQVIHMEMGEPDFSTPQPIIEAGVAALRSGITHYTPTLGLPALREAIANFYITEYRVTVDPEQIVITPGSATALQLVLNLMVSDGDAVVIPDPAYPSTHNLVRLLGGTVLQVAVNEDSFWQLTVELLEEHWNDAINAVLLASPSNPTGTILEDVQLQKIADFCESKGVFLLVDEIYHGLVYGQAPKTAVDLNDNTFVINSFSKFYGMTGWRVGWIVSPKAYLQDLNKLAQHTFLAAPTPGQYGALAAFDDDTKKILVERRDEFKARRDYLYEALTDLGFKMRVKPQGAFYIYADCSEFCEDSYEFACNILRDKHVAFTPGIDFGLEGAKQHVRFAYTTNIENLKIGVARLAELKSKA